MKIGLDAMGGDFGPAVTFAGAIEAAKILREDTIVLYGNKELIDAQKKDFYRWKKWKKIPENIEIVDCKQEVLMTDKPHIAFKEKPESSIAVALKDHKLGKANGFVSAGNTGAVMLSSVMILGRLEGVDKPAIATILPSKTKTARTLIIDAGANVDVKPNNIDQFAQMGYLYVKYIDEVDDPRIGLLSVGTEKSKGNQLTIQSHEILEKKYPSFIGNLEGRDIIEDKADVIVMDGFVGNVILKLTESIAETLIDQFQKLIKKIKTKIAYTIFKKEIVKLKKMYDYAEYGGAPLLGINGNVIICHGVSSASAIKNALLFVKKLYETELNEKIKEELRNGKQEN